MIHSELRPLAQVPEPELVQMAQNRDETAFEELMRRNASTSFRLALSVLKDRQEAEDQVQNSFFNAWKRLGTFKSEARFSTWFRTIVFNQSLMRLRVVKRANLQSLDDGGEQDRPREYPTHDLTPEQILSQSQLTEQLRAETQRLPPLLREVLILRDLEESPIEEIASRLEISEPAVKSRLSRARAMLRQRMQAHVGSSVGAL